MFPTILAVALFFATPAVNWYDHYERGVRLIEQGKAADARSELEAALTAHPAEGLQLATAPRQYTDYLPHLYLAIADQMSGDVAAARKQLALAEDSGVALKSEAGRSLLVAYQLLLRGDSTGKFARPAYAVYSERPPVLSESEFSMLRTDVLNKCNLPDAKLSDAPWYARYELALELERKGDYPRALRQLIDAVALRPNPQRHARMYGMWLIDYYPYFHIAREHVRLENWECARNAIDISQRLGEIPTDAPEINELMALQQETARKLSTSK
jgi:tetratricopeptide (TPR) repeat protein